MSRKSIQVTSVEGRNRLRLISDMVMNSTACSTTWRRFCSAFGDPIPIRCSMTALLTITNVCPVSSWQAISTPASLAG
ncbi:hypothetical protein [Sphingomonas sp. R86520]|uniref:hypothetical protein n=1 Tax=Sphingomonas sp. R86520 TaxID=3093859 RepID=UPI0036D344E9